MGNPNQLIQSRINCFKMYIWKHWKTSKNKEKNLIKLGLLRYAAHGTSYAKEYVRVYGSRNLHSSTNKERLAKFGFVSMEDYYAERCVIC